MKSRPRVIAACIVVLVALAVWALWASLHPGRGQTPFSRTPFLRDVVEPITIVTSMSFDDGGSSGFRFADARGTLRDVCLEDRLAWEGDPHAAEGLDNLILNSFTPDGEKGRRVPKSGAEEKALLALLERWASRDPEAKEIKTVRALRTRSRSLAISLTASRTRALRDPDGREHHAALRGRN